MKKYPVHYKGKEYEVRWKVSRWGNYVYNRSLCIYEVKTICKFKVYKKVISFGEEDIREFLADEKRIYSWDPNFHIEEIKMLFYLWERCIEEKNKRDELNLAKEQVLENWDGIIE